jgi:predicted O-linked N-acetylglucosamine transferase (SPINDLY family)
LPNNFLCFTGEEQTELIREIPFIRNNYITFGSFNNFSKITDETIKIWSSILNLIPNSRLVLKTSRENLEFNRYIKLFSNEGVEKKRIEYINRMSNYRDHLELYNKIDIALDTFPYNGTTTTFEALWMGVPVITKRGDNHVSSVGASILTNIGLQNFIAKDLNQYIDLAKNISTDIDYLKVLRLSLREKLKKSLLCDGVSFAKDIEDAYKSVYENYFRKQKI